LTGTPGKDDWTASCTVKRKGQDPITQTFSWAEAKRAELTSKDPWKKYPRRMLAWRARGYAFRDTFPDVLSGCYVAGDRDDAINELMDSIEFTKEPAPPVSRTDALTETLTQSAVEDPTTIHQDAVEPGFQMIGAATDEPAPDPDVVSAQKFARMSVLALPSAEQHRVLEAAGLSCIEERDGIEDVGTLEGIKDACRDARG